MITNRMMSCFAAFALLMLATDAAEAHAALDHASPRVGSTVRSAPHEVSLWFTEKLEPTFSRIEVRDASGKRVDSGKTVVDSENPVELRVGLKPLPAGSYKVFWHVLSVDTHTTQGSFSFRVAR